MWLSKVKITKKLIKIFQGLLSIILNFLLCPLHLSVVHKNANKDFVLYQYDSYDEYKKMQIFHNIRKLEKVWADDHTLDRVAERALSLKTDGSIEGLCHGTRNGYEQSYLSAKFNRINAIGTDISASASNFPLSFVWDFHEQKDECVSNFVFVYSNSLDQAWNPQKALALWLEQIKPDGLVIVELTVAGHGPGGVSNMDPFGVRPVAFPYVLTEWFGENIKLSHSVERKSNMAEDAWLFFISNV